MEYGRTYKTGGADRRRKNRDNVDTTSNIYDDDVEKMLPRDSNLPTRTSTNIAEVGGEGVCRHHRQAASAIATADNASSINNIDKRIDVGGNNITASNVGDDAGTNITTTKIGNDHGASSTSFHSNNDNGIICSDKVHRQDGTYTTTITTPGRHGQKNDISNLTNTAYDVQNHLSPSFQRLGITGNKHTRPDRTTTDEGTSSPVRKPQRTFLRTASNSAELDGCGGGSHYVHTKSVLIDDNNARNQTYKTKMDCGFKLQFNHSSSSSSDDGDEDYDSGSERAQEQGGRQNMEENANHQFWGEDSNDDLGNTIGYNTTFVTPQSIEKLCEMGRSHVGNLFRPHVQIIKLDDIGRDGKVKWRVSET